MVTLNESQRAMVAAKLANITHGGNRKSPIGDLSQDRAAELLNVGKRTVERAKDVRDHAVPELARKVERGQLSVSTAADVARLPKPQQREIVARGEKEILAAAKDIRRAKQVRPLTGEAVELALGVVADAGLLRASLLIRTRKICDFSAGPMRRQNLARRDGRCQRHKLRRRSYALDHGPGGTVQPCAFA